MISAKHQAVKANGKPRESDVSGINAIIATRATRENTCWIVITKFDFTKPVATLNIYNKISNIN